DREAVGSGRHVEIAAHRQPGEGGVDPVDVAEAVRDEGKRKQPQVDLAHRRLFERCIHVFSPVAPPYATRVSCSTTDFRCLVSGQATDSITCLAARAERPIGRLPLGTEDASRSQRSAVAELYFPPLRPSWNPCPHPSACPSAGRLSWAAWVSPQDSSG